MPDKTNPFWMMLYRIFTVVMTACIPFVLAGVFNTYNAVMESKHDVTQMKGDIISLHEDVKTEKMDRIAEIFILRSDLKDFKNEYNEDFGKNYLKSIRQR